MKALRVTMVALPIVAAACAQPAQDAYQYRAAAMGFTTTAAPDPGRQPAPTALKSFDSVFDAQYVRRASITPAAATR